MFDGAEKPTRAVEDYVKAIYSLDERGCAVTTTVLAVELQVTASSVSAMLGRLRAMGLISHRPYSDVSLSSAGMQLAMRVIRRRRLVELFLVESLGYGWEEVEQRGRGARARRFGVIRREDRGKARQPGGGSAWGSHSHPDGQLLAAPSELLSRLEPGAVGRLVRVWNGNPEVLRYLDTCSIDLGDRIEVLGREPFGGSVVIRVGDPKEGRVHGFGYGLAEVLSIELDRDGAAS